jgi:hypothetical protein
MVISSQSMMAGLGGAFCVFCWPASLVSCVFDNLIGDPGDIILIMKKATRVFFCYHLAYILEFVGEPYRFRQRMHLEEQQSVETKTETG